jgi:hypothetical protein
MEEAPEAVVPCVVEAWELPRQHPTRASAPLCCVRMCLVCSVSGNVQPAGYLFRSVVGLHTICHLFPVS